MKKFIFILFFSMIQVLFAEGVTVAPGEKSCAHMGNLFYKAYGSGNDYNNFKDFNHIKVKDDDCTTNGDCPSGSFCCSGGQSSSCDEEGLLHKCVRENMLDFWDVEDAAFNNVFYAGNMTTSALGDHIFHQAFTENFINNISGYSGVLVLRERSGAGVTTGMGSWVLVSLAEEMDLKKALLSCRWVRMMTGWRCRQAGLTAAL